MCGLIIFPFAFSIYSFGKHVHKMNISMNKPSISKLSSAGIWTDYLIQPDVQYLPCTVDVLLNGKRKTVIIENARAKCDLKSMRELLIHFSFIYYLLVNKHNYGKHSAVGYLVHAFNAVLCSDRQNCCCFLFCLTLLNYTTISVIFNIHVHIIINNKPYFSRHVM